MHQLPKFNSQYLLTTLLLITELAYANPELNTVISGNASVHQTPNTTIIQQSSQKAILDWHSFNIQPQELTHFNQPPGGITLNRINSNQGVSQIYGNLSATGKIILINGAGLHFGPGAQVNVGGIIASTLNLSNENFLANKYIFEKGSERGSIIVDRNATLRAADKGLVALIGDRIENHGYIEARLGTVALGSGTQATLDFNGSDLIHFAVDDTLIHPDHPQVKKGVKNTGKIYADGGKIYVSAAAASHVLDKVINMKGVVQARGIELRQGKIILHAGNQGRIKLAGRLDASSSHAGSRGGKIKVVAKTIQVKAADLDVSGHSGGGTLILGAESAKRHSPITATVTQISPEASLHADATVAGKGGKLIIRAQNEVEAHGQASAQGAQGGFIETTSGHYLNVDEFHANLSAAHGAEGTWLLEANNLTLKDSKKVEVEGNWGKTFSSIDAATLQVNLERANITVEASKGGLQQGDLTVAADVTWASSTTLTLSAYRNLDFVKGVISNQAGGHLVLKTNQGGEEGGAVNFFKSSPQLKLSGGGSAILYDHRDETNVEPVTYAKHVDFSEDTHFISVDNENIKAVGESLVFSEADLLSLSSDSLKESWIVVSNPSAAKSSAEDFELLGSSDLAQAESLLSLPSSALVNSSLIDAYNEQYVAGSLSLSELNPKVSQTASSWASLDSLAALLGEGSQLDASLASQSLGQSLPSFAVLNTSLPSLAQIPTQMVSVQQPAPPVWTATPWQPAQPVAPLPQGQDPLWVIEGEA